MSRVSFVLMLLALLAGCQNSKPETLVEGGYDEQEMNRAIERARGEVDQFIAELSSPTGTDHAVKAPIVDENGTEHFWLTDVKYQNGKFEGTINNDPGIVKNVQIGQRWTVGKTEISDWMYMRDEKMYGNYTLRPLMKTMPEEQATQLRSILAEP